MHETVGIDQIGVYLPRYAVRLDALADARGVPREKIALGLGCQEMALAAPWEDTVTLATNAAARIFARGESTADEIGLLLVATETAVDHAKPASIFVHDLLDAPSNCRTYELKHACYSGTAGVMIAAEWIRSGAARGRKALVIASDIARYDLGSSAEFTQGAGAVAMIVSPQPRLLALGPHGGVFAKQVYDFWRPLERREALVDGKFSLACYLDALDGAVADYRTHNGNGAADLLHERFAALLYHTPFPKMAYKAHLRLIESEWRRAGRPAEALNGAAQESFAAQVEPYLAAAAAVGNTYTASLYLCLAWLLERYGTRLGDRSLGLFSYGSGCCAEFFSGHLVADPRQCAIGVADLLAQRLHLSVPEYEAFMRRGSGGGTPPEDERVFCSFAGIRDDKRLYERRAVWC